MYRTANLAKNVESHFIFHINTYLSCKLIYEEFYEFFRLEVNVDTIACDASIG